MFLNPLGGVCQFTMKVFFESFKLVFSLVGKVFMCFVFNVNVPFFFF